VQEGLTNARSPGRASLPTPLPQGLVALTVQLEQCLPNLPGSMPQPHLLTSPYREPLCRFLSRWVSGQPGGPFAIGWSWR
jgi:hypothetical protein